MAAERDLVLAADGRDPLVVPGEVLRPGPASYSPSDALVRPRVPTLDLSAGCGRSDAVAPPLVPEGATTAEACFYLFMSLTPRALSSVADGLVRLNACDPASGLPYAATATVFASHAWKYEFALLLAALSTTRIAVNHISTSVSRTALYH